MNKRTLTIALLLPAALLFQNCGKASDKAPAVNDTPVIAETPDTMPDTAHADNIPFEVKKFEKEKGDNELEIEYPVSGNPEVVDSVRSWINGELTGTFTGNPADAEAFFRHYASQLGTDPDLNEYGGYTIDKFEIQFVNDLIVTYSYTTYLYEGGAHGEGGVYGATFLQSDGTLFSKSCFTSMRELRPLFIEGLKRYFKVTSDEELMGCLLNVKSLSTLPMPGRDPWIEEDGVVFSYTPYEIAPYSSGSPRFTIPFDKIRPYLTEKGRSFID